MKKDIENMKEYEKNMKEIWRNMYRKYEGICEEYVKNMKEYEEICQYIGFGTPISIWALELGKVSETWKNSELSPFIWAFGLGKIPRRRLLLSSPDLEKFWALPLYSFWDFKKCWASPSFDYSLLAMHRA